MRFLDRLLGRKGSSQGGGRPGVAVFGKHPGWGDHIDRLGRWSEALGEIREVLYTDGIGRAIGAWGELDRDDRVEGFDHRFVWRVGTTSAVGRMWSSRDAGNRQVYPLVGVIAARSDSPAFVARLFEGILDRLESGLRERESASAVTALIESLQSEADEAWAGREATPRSERAPADVASEISSRIEDETRWRRVLYEAAVKLEGFHARDRSSSSARLTRAQHLRTPRLASSDTDELSLWSDLWSAICEMSVPFAVFTRSRSAFSDSLVGVGRDADFSFLQKAESVLPGAARIEYELDDRGSGWLDAALAKTDARR